MRTLVFCALPALTLFVVFTAGLPVAGPRRVDSHIAVIHGSCAAGRSLGDISGYAIPLRAEQNNLGYIRIRSDACWRDLNNVIGTVPCGTLLWAEGPLKDADEPGGIGYAVAVQDDQGHICRGYVSYTVVGGIAFR